MSLPVLPGSQHHELVIAASLRHPELAGPRHGHPSRWDWGVTYRSALEAQQRHARLKRFAAQMTPDERAALWSDPSPEAAELRRVVSR